MLIYIDTYSYIIYTHTFIYLYTYSGIYIYMYILECLSSTKKEP